MNAPAPPHPHAPAAAVRPARAHGGVGLAWALPAALIGWVAGTALQLQQADLWSAAVYVGLGTLGACLGVGGWFVLRRRGLHAAWVGSWMTALAAALLALAQTGWRAAQLPAPRRIPMLFKPWSGTAAQAPRQDQAESATAQA